MDKRASGIILHITSLASKFGIGDFGPAAFRFVDFLARCGVSYWQILPLNPTNQIFGNSPYSSHSAFAGNILLISPEELVKDKLLDKKDIKVTVKFNSQTCEYDKAIPLKIKLLNIAYENFLQNSILVSEFKGFCQRHSFWLDDFSLFVVIKEKFQQKPWPDWPEDLKFRREEALKDFQKQNKSALEKEKFFQFIFYRQWFNLKEICRKKKVKLIGDIPIYVSYDSADVWANSRFFRLSRGMKPLWVAGVPPDYFSETGQLWGNPVYKWSELKKDNYSWWIKRFRHNFSLFDIIRVDHFRGFVGFWAVPAKEKTAVNGRWVKAKPYDFFDSLKREFKTLAIIAEDLGIITDDVKEVIKHYNFPGMRVLLFAFGDDDPGHPYLPGNYIENCIAYTGTHDNNTIKGWFDNEASEDEKRRLISYLEKKVNSKTIHWELIKLIFESKANTAIIPMQDILGLDEGSRMNYPSRPLGNWQWRLDEGLITEKLAERLLNLNKKAKRI